MRNISLILYGIFLGGFVVLALGGCAEYRVAMATVKGAAEQAPKLLGQASTETAIAAEMADDLALDSWAAMQQGVCTMGPGKKAYWLHEIKQRGIVLTADYCPSSLPPIEIDIDGGFVPADLLEE